MRPSATLAAAFAAGASAQNYLGFNSGSTLPDKSAKFKKDFLAEFKTGAALEGAPGKFNSVRLYTNIQAYSQDDPIEAFEAAIETKTNILLGVWASGTDSIDKEINALKKALTKYGQPFVDLVIGASIGSEDLYRNSATGVANKAGIGAQPDQLVKFIKQFKDAFANTALAKVPIGHVDTWDVWVNGTNKPVLDIVDFLGVDEYPYYESGKGNDIKNSGQLFDRAYDQVLAVAGSKPVWMTETGWPVTGPDWDLAKPSVENARYYWVEVGCRRLFNKTPTFWYTLRDSNPDNEMKFAITKDLSPKAMYDLSCPTTFQTPSSSGPSAGGSNPSSNNTTSSSPNGGGSNPASGSSNNNAPNPVQNTPGASVQTGKPNGAGALSVSAYAGLVVVGGLFALL